MKKILFVWVLIFSIEVITVSCNIFCQCGCGNEDIHKIKILSWIIDTITSENMQADEFATYPYQQVYKSLRIGDRQIALAESTQKGNLILSTYACQPAPIEVVQTFTSIQLVSKVEISWVDPNDLIKVGDEISDRFQMGHSFPISFKAIEEFTNALVIYDTHEYLLRLNKKPFEEKTITFDILISMSDGGFFELKDQVLKVN